MSKALRNSRQITIERLREFLKESVNLEPELEQFIKTLLLTLEFSEQENFNQFPPSPDHPSKFQH